MTELPPQKPSPPETTVTDSAVAHSAVNGVVDDEGDRISVTDANGTVARFEMTYSPRASPRTKFGPPLPSRVP
ncbi:MAG: hypothetical protein M3O50_00690, partial [Myxococcota bacterium]|nr:hypothetical protein [Myxococcota bacterium]